MRTGCVSDLQKGPRKLIKRNFLFIFVLQLSSLDICSKKKNETPPCHSQSRQIQIRGFGEGEGDRAKTFSRLAAGKKPLEPE